ncbi:MAG: hypothetical protein AB4352_08855 [Hormoscilla sp.]
MTRLVHDQFAKQYLSELLNILGEVEISKEITSEVRQIDVFFIPAADAASKAEQIGLLGQLAAKGAAGFEVFRNAVEKKQIRECMGKIYDDHSLLERQARRKNATIEEAEYPRVWIITPTISPEILQSFRAEPDTASGMRGIYSLGEGLKTGLIAIHQLPSTPETMWLRILGRSSVQEQAMRELEALSEDNPLREHTLELVYDLLSVLEARQRNEADLDTDDQDLIMKLSPVYLERLKTATEQGVQQGVQQGLQQGVQQGLQQGLQQLMRERQDSIESMLRMRFGEIDPQLSAIIPELLTLSGPEYIAILLELSREQLLARFSGN